MTMFVRAIEGFIGRIVILLVLCLIVLFLAYQFTNEVSGIAQSNQVEGLIFQIKLAWSNVVEFFVDIYLWLQSTSL